MPHSTRALLIASSLLAVLSCGDPTGPADGLRIQATKEAIYLTNTDDEQPLYSVVLDSYWSSRADWSLACDPYCGTVPPNSTRKVTASAANSGPGREVDVYYWRVLPGVADAPEKGPVTIVRLRLIDPIAP